MARQASLLAVTFALLSSFCFAQFMSNPMDRARDNTLTQGFSNRTATLDGTVVNALNNQPLQDARVELRDAGNGTVVTSSFTNSAGAFDFGSVPQGIYRVVAVRGISQVEERIDISSFRNTVNLRMSISNQPEAGNTGNTVSVAQYRVPEKARGEFQKAQEASAKLNFDEARKHVERALGLYPDYAGALTLRAVLNLASNTAAAITDLQKAIQCDGNYALAYTVLGSALNMQEKFGDAIQTLQRGQSLAPDSWQAYFEMARSYVGKQDYASALRQLDRAQSLVPTEYPTLLLVRAQANVGLKQYETAMEELQKFLQKEPNGPNSMAAEKMLQQTRELVARN
jgi:tetratricopeptide (TPR) repeat protein